MSEVPSCVGGTRDRSAENCHGDCSIAPTRDEIAQATDVERDIDCESHRVERVDTGPFELVEAPLEHRVGSGTLDARTNRRCSGCGSDHGEAIGSGSVKL